MNHDKLYEDWRRRCRQTDAPHGFADRVMAAIGSHETGKRQRSLLTGMMLALMSSRLGKISLCSLAAAICVFRLLHVVAIFVAQ
jgi:hypothetical protein